MIISLFSFDIIPDFYEQHAFDFIDSSRRDYSAASSKFSLYQFFFAKYMNSMFFVFLHIQITD